MSNRLVSEINCTEKDVNIHIVKAWIALNKISVICKADLPSNLKWSYLRATVEAMLIYRSNAWKLTKPLESKHDGIYTRMLRAIIKISLRQLPNKSQLCRLIRDVSKI